jgi:hypothetical protein
MKRYIFVVLHLLRGGILHRLDDDGIGKHVPLGFWEFRGDHGYFKKRWNYAAGCIVHLV